MFLAGAVDIRGYTDLCRLFLGHSSGTVKPGLYPLTHIYLESKLSNPEGSDRQ